MKLSAYYSQKLTLLSFISIIMVVYIHSFYNEAVAYPISRWLQLFISGLTSCAVPLFYIISGFLFFMNVDSYKKCYPKIRKRFNTLLIPFVIWNLIYIGWYIILDLTPGISNYVNSDLVKQLDWTRPIYTLYFIFLKPAGFHLWFLRDLILFVIISPIIYIAVRKLKWFSLVLIFIASGWMTRFWLSYFVLGAIVGIFYKIDDTQIKDQYIIIASIVYIAAAAISATINIPILLPEYICNYISFFTTFCGVLSIWGLYDLICSYHKLAENKFILEIVSFSFFIYLFHEPTFNILKKLTISIFGAGEISLIIFYLLNPWIMIAVAIGIGIVLKKSTPKVYNLLTGGR